MKKTEKHALQCRICVTVALTAIVLACVTSFSCQLNPEGVTFLRGSYDCPKLLDFSIEGTNELQLVFSQEVEFTEISITQADQQQASGASPSAADESGSAGSAAPQSPVSGIVVIPPAAEVNNGTAGNPVQPAAPADNSSTTGSATGAGSTTGSGDADSGSAGNTAHPAEAETGSPGEKTGNTDASLETAETSGDSICPNPDQTTTSPATETPVTPPSETDDSVTHIESATVTVTEDGNYQYDLTFSDDFDSDTTYLLYAVVEDTNGNSLSFSSGFSGYNDNLPEIVLSEVNTEWNNPKAEYIELYVLEDGNLGGLCVDIYYGKNISTYIFPSVDVQQGDFIVLHLRNTAPGAADETGAIDVSSSKDSCPAARDFWFPSETKIINKTGIILLRERENGPLLDALFFAESSKTSWPRDEWKTTAQTAFMARLWPEGSEITGAVCTDKVSSTRTLSRQDYYRKGASAWLLVATSCATPGAANSDKPYVQ